MGTDWHDQAACRISDPEDFFPISDVPTAENARKIRHAQKVCATCPVMDVCLQFALAAEEGEPLRFRHGVWGGLTPLQRIRIVGPAKREPNWDLATPNVPTRPAPAPRNGLGQFRSTHDRPAHRISDAQGPRAPGVVASLTTRKEDSHVPS